MDTDISPVVPDEQIASVIKCGATSVNNKELLFAAVEQCRRSIAKCPREFLEESLLLYLMGSIENLFIKIYTENDNMNTKEEVKDISCNLMMALSLSDSIGNILDYISASIDTENYIVTLRIIFLKMPSCFLLTYNHCRHGQKKYQILFEDCKDVITLYKKNQGYYEMFLKILNKIIVDSSHSESIAVLIHVVQLLSRINETLSGLHVKSLTESWKGYCNLIEKHHEIIGKGIVYCTKEIGILKQQIQSFMDIVLSNEDEQQRLLYIKLSGFLLKVALKLILKFWEPIKLNHLEEILDLTCTVFKYSLDFSTKWKVSAETETCIQSYVQDVLEAFLHEYMFHEHVIHKLVFSITQLDSRSIGCVILDLKILRYIHSQPKNSVDNILFRNVMNHIFSDISLLFPELSFNSDRNRDNILSRLCTEITWCIRNQNALYTLDFERTLIENILGGDWYCHVFASEVWINILSFVGKDTRKSIVIDLMETIKSCIVDPSFCCTQLISLSRFMKRLMLILGNEEKTDILKLNSPEKNIELWNIAGISHISIDQELLFVPLKNLALSKMENFRELNTFEDIMLGTNALKIISNCYNQSTEIPSSQFISVILKIWAFNYQSANKNNSFLKVFISTLCNITSNLVEYLSDNQMHFVLKKMKAIATTSFFKLQLCNLLNVIAIKLPERTMGQSTVKSVLSDIFEILFIDKDEVIRDLGLKIFRQFAKNNQYTIVNNVCRMLPTMKLEQYLQKSSVEIDMTELREMFNNGIIMEHVCLKSASSLEVKKLITRNICPDIFDGTIEGVVEERINKNVSHKPVQIKRFKSNDDDQMDDDTITEILQRIKSEIKCLNKILSKEKMTPKNAQSVKLLVSQLQNTLGSNN